MQWQNGNVEDPRPQPRQKCDRLYATAPAFFGVVTARWKFFSNFNSAAGSFSSDLPLKGFFFKMVHHLATATVDRYFLEHPAFLVFLLGRGR